MGFELELGAAKTPSSRPFKWVRQRNVVKILNTAALLLARALIARPRQKLCYRRVKCQGYSNRAFNVATVMATVKIRVGISVNSSSTWTLYGFVQNHRVDKAGLKACERGCRHNQGDSMYKFLLACVQVKYGPTKVGSHDNRFRFSKLCIFNTICA